MARYGPVAARAMGPACAALLCAAGAADAQEQPRREDPAAPRAGCFQPRPLPACGSYWVLEMAALLHLGGTAETFQAAPEGPAESIRAYGPHLSWELGYMANVGGRTALGGTLLLGVGGPAERVGAKLRYRRWLGGSSSVEVAPGVLYARVDGFSQRPGYGFTGDVRLGPDDRYAFVLRYEHLRTERLGTADGLYGGASLNGKPALYGTAAAAVVGAAYVLLFWLGTASGDY